MTKLAAGARVVTSPLIQDGVIMIAGEMFDDGLFRLVAPKDTGAEVLIALDAAVREFDALQFRQQWAADVIRGLTDRPDGSQS